ncbi:thiamine-phosphate kinase [Candidatus Woesearchaeota archaeon]|nr:thiamine-phosphate kinase [Candidatus Woesearchaeota archaeon]
MKIKGIGGEFGLIERIKKNVRLFSKDVILGIGDDSAVLKYGKKYLLLKTDMLVQDVHFSLKHSTPEQIGARAIEQNVSDIASMGGLPKYALVSLALPKNTEVDFVDRLYRGINKKSGKYKISVVGGDLSQSSKVVVGIFLAGFVENKYLALRSGARISDLVFCSGDAGKSAVGLELLKNNKKGKSIKKHLEPCARLDLARKLAKIGINSMIDISDGIASEIGHICHESKVGAVIYADKIPMSKNTINDAKKLNKNPLDFALYGGEDFELVFTADKSKLKQLKKYDVKVIGKIVDKKYGIKLVKNNKEFRLKSGFDHFK